MPITQLHRKIAIGTPLGPDKLLLRGFKVTETLGRLFRIEADLCSEDESIRFDDIVGRNVTLRLDTTREPTRYFNGIVARFSQGGTVGRLASYQAEIVPWLWLLTRTSDCRIFQNKKVPDILKETLRDHDLADFDDRLTGSYREWEYCVQYRETDFNFVSRLMEQEGIYYYFEHENGKHRMILCDSPSTVQVYPGYGSISFHAPEHETADVEQIRRWFVRKEVQPGSYVLADFDFKNPQKDLEVPARIPRQHMAADFEMYDYPGEYTEFSDGERYARTRIEECHTEHEVMGGETDARGVCTGYKFCLSDFPRSDQCKEHLVTSTTLQARTDEFEPGAAGGGSQITFACSFQAIDAALAFRPARITPKPLIHGPQTAIVVGPAGDEIHTDPYGRVKVQFHWDRRSKGNETSSCWIRVAQYWAGKKWGAMYIPRIGQEVVVEHLEADPDQPIITGRVYNGEAMPPYDLPANKTRSTLKSNSSKGGEGFNEIRIEDKKGQEQVFIHAERNMDERVKAASMETIGASRHLTVGGDQLELVEGDKWQQIKCDLSLKVNGLTGFYGGEGITCKSGKWFSMEAADNIEFLSATEFVAEATSKITLKCGGSSIVLTPSAIYIQGGPNVMINSGAGGPSTAPSIPVLEDVQPVAADTAIAGAVESVSKPKPPKPATYSDAAKVMKMAADDGTPFCEECARAAAAAKAKAAKELQSGKTGKAVEAPSAKTAKGKTGKVKAEESAFAKGAKTQDPSGKGAKDGEPLGAEKVESGAAAAKAAKTPPPPPDEGKVESAAAAKGAKTPPPPADEGKVESAAAAKSAPPPAPAPAKDASAVGQQVSDVLDSEGGSASIPIE